MTQLHFLTFGDGSIGYRAAVHRLTRQARVSNAFDTVKGHTLDTLRREHPKFWHDHGKFITANRRGFGYWLWKPFLICETLARMQDGDFLLYADSGCEIHPRSEAAIADLLPAGPGEELTAYVIGGHSVRQWTNSYTLKRIEAAERFIDRPQIAAGLLCVRNSSRTRALMRRWWELSSLDNSAFLIDRPTEAEPPAFIEHRHDQSLFSILVYEFERSEGPVVKFLDRDTFDGPDATAPIRADRNRTGVSVHSASRRSVKAMTALMRQGNRELRAGFRSLIGEAGAGALDFYLGRRLGDDHGGPFHGRGGMALFEAVAKVQMPRLILEVGTFRGATTEKLAAIGAPVVTVEPEPRNFGFARARLRKFPNVDLRLGDSRRTMRGLFERMGPAEEQGTLFAYLDAHRHTDLPPAEEIKLAFRWDPGAIVMIDHFQLRDDRAAGCDEDDREQALTEEYVVPACEEFGLVRLYPARPARNERGVSRKSVVLASEARWKAKLLSTGLLRLG